MDRKIFRAILFYTVRYRRIVNVIIIIIFLDTLFFLFLFFSFLMTIFVQVVKERVTIKYCVVLMVVHI